jgi:hypothetical protein
MSVGYTSKPSIKFITNSNPNKVIPKEAIVNANENHVNYNISSSTKISKKEQTMIAKLKKNMIQSLLLKT